MKNLALVLIITISTISTIHAQRSVAKAQSFTEKSLYELKDAINQTVDSKMTVEQKDKLTIKMIKQYLMTSEADVLMSSTKCNRGKTVKLIKQLKMKGYDVVPHSFISKNESSTNSCELSKAVQIYNMVGHELETNENLCTVMSCDDIVDTNNPTKMAPVAPSKTTWKYTGVRKYFLEKEKHGWRYLCIASTSKGKVSMSKEMVEKGLAELDENIAAAEKAGRPIDNSLLPMTFKKHELSWKVDYQVNIW